MLLYFATTNSRKFQEAKKILSDVKILQARLDLPELQGKPEEVAMIKAEIAYAQLKKPILVDDTGLSFHALNGMPGIYIKHFLKALKPTGLYRLLSGYKDKSATAYCTIGYCDGKKVKTFTGECKGTIVKPKGKYFGWDPIFRPEGFNNTFAELDEKTKNSISHRKNALEKLRKYLKYLQR